MPRIIVEADALDRGERSAVTLLESIVPTQIESEHFSGQLVERLRWAVADAVSVESSVLSTA
jgi:hypothetical protein